LTTELHEINKLTSSNTEKIISESEAFYRQQVDAAADFVCEKSGHELVMLAGPSCSGKTTTAKILAESIGRHSRKAKIISLDDFYLYNTKQYFFEDGTPDYETVESLDIEYIDECLSSLIKDGKCLLPQFNFVTKKREDELLPITLEKDEIVIVEGLHAINPVITDSLDSSMLFKLYVCVDSEVSDKNGVLLSKRELRLIRRIIRDYHCRATDAEGTFYLWNGVIQGEDRYLASFASLADKKINSFHSYEPCAFKSRALKLLDRIGKDSVYYDSALKLKDKLSCFKSMDEALVPSNSLLREFIS